MTVSRAYSILEMEGVLSRWRGLGIIGGSRQVCRVHEQEPNPCDPKLDTPRDAQWCQGPVWVGSGCSQPQRGR